MSLETLKSKVSRLIDNVRFYKEQNAELTANNEALQSENETLETRVDELEASIKPEQEKAVDINENGTTEVLPDENKTLSRVTVNVDVPDTGEQLETLIDQSGVLGTTDETVTVTEKVEQLIDKAQWEKIWYESSSIWTAQFQKLFSNNKAIKTLPKFNFENATTLADFCSNGVIERVDYYINSGKTSSVRSAFNSCNNLTFVYGIDTSNVQIFEYSFKGCILLKTIQEPLSLKYATNVNQMFYGCTALINVSFATESIKFSITIPSPVLSIGNVFDLTDTENVGSVQSIINGLVTLAEGAAAQTLTLSKNLPLTAEQKQAITTAVNNKGWTLAFA